MNVDLGGKRAIVCGSTQGIGKAVAVELAGLGASVTLVARDEHALSAVRDELTTDRGQSHSFIAADFAYPEQLREKLDFFVASHPPFHVLVNNTGGPPGGPAAEASPEEFVDAFAKHLLCNHILMQALVPGMKQEGYGRIVNIISTSVKQPLRGLGVSNTIRGAVANWSKTLAAELGGSGITVNNVLPGATNTGRLATLQERKAERLGVTLAEVTTEMLAEIPLGRIAEPHEIASAVAFLASPAAAYINGINLPVDGGRLACL